MSVNTSIKEGGKPFSFGPTKYLRVSTGDGNHALWIPESERTLETLNVDKNGIYQASRLGVYGWGSVSVNVPNPESITGSDGDGDTVVVYPDPETGRLVEEKVPDSIVVITPPTNPYGIYSDGQSISTNDMVVKAYLTSGVEWGVVPNGEITLNPTTAQFDPDHISDGDGVNAALYTLPTELTRVGGWGSYYVGPLVGREQIDGQWYNVWLAGSGANASGAKVYYTLYNDVPYAKSDQIYYNINVGYVRGVEAPSINFDIRTLYPNRPFSAETWHIPPKFEFNFPVSTKDPTRAGTLNSMQTITVSWPRPGDGAVLETTFDIPVGHTGGRGEG